MEPGKIEGKRRLSVVGPRLVPGTNGKINPNFIRYNLNKASALLGNLSEQTGEAMRRMNLPPNHDAAIPPKSLVALLVVLRAETERAVQLLDQAINEFATLRQ